MTERSVESAERISALLDGQLQGAEFDQALAELAFSNEARSDWDTYHLVGDIMRSGAVPVCAHDADFVLKLRQRIAKNAIEMVAIPAVEIRAGAQKHLKQGSANDASWRRVAGLASVVLAAVLTWQGLHWAASSDQASAAQLAQQSVVPSTPTTSSAALTDAMATSPAAKLIRNDGSSALALTSEPQVMIRDPQLDALLAAHRQFGGTSALQMPAGFMRNATFEEGGR